MKLPTAANRQPARGLLLALLTTVAAAQSQAELAEIERLAGALEQAGVEAREQRAAAIERLLVMPWLPAHQPLQLALEVVDVDRRRSAVLDALGRHLLLAEAQQFGGASLDARRGIVLGYLRGLSAQWSADAAGAEVSTAARQVVRRFSLRDLELAARSLAANDPAGRPRLFACLADSQRVAIGQVLAGFVEDADPATRLAARRSLRRLTFHEEDFTSAGQFLAWLEVHGEERYVDLAERAARDAELRLDRVRVEQARIRAEAAREVVRVHASHKAGIDWAAIQARTLVDEVAILDVCLEQLQQSLAVPSLVAEDSPLPRQAFCRALLQRWRTEGGESTARRALLLEVAAYVARPEDVELATELVGLHLAQLDAGDPVAASAALRALRRFPSIDTRTRVVQYTLRQVAAGESAMPQVAAALQTLSSRTAPRWSAPAANDPDKADWLQLVRELCLQPTWRPLRAEALALGLGLDPKDARVPEVYDLLLDAARDRSLDVEFRSSCLIHLQGWRDQQALADSYVAAMHALLDDMGPQVRQLAAESLGRLPEVVDPRREQWLASTIMALRDRLRSEANPTVLRALVDAMQVCGREPQMPGKAIGALNYVLAELGQPVPAEHVFRLEPLLTALAAIAGDPRADRGQWLGACAQLAANDRRSSLRLVLTTQGAAELAKDVMAADPVDAERAREAMVWLIRTAMLKPARETWADSDDLLREARDVRSAFGALDGLPEGQRLDEPRHRLLRLEVELACSKFQDAAQRAAAWLAGTPPAPAPGAAAPVPFTVEQRDQLRLLAAEAQLGLGKPDQSLRLLAERDPEHAAEAATLNLQWRVAAALATTDTAAAVELQEKVWRLTPPEDGTFRGRLLDWATGRLRQDGAVRAAVLGEVDKFRSLFESPDCPADLRATWQQIHSGS